MEQRWLDFIEQGETPSILLVDDREANLRTMEVVLEPLQVRTYCATSGEAALALTLEHDFALALIDVQMPGMDGYETVQLLRQTKKTAHMPVIFVSAIFSGEVHHLRGVESGAVDFIEKPIVPALLLGKVRIFLDLYRHKQALQKANLFLEAQVREKTLKLTAEIEQRKEIEKQLRVVLARLEKTNAELSRFAFISAHDLKEPLRSVVSFSQLLKKRLGQGLDRETKEYLHYIIEGTHTLDAMIDGLLQVSQINETSAAMQPVNLRRSLDRVLQQMQPQIQESQVNITMTDLPTLMAVPSQMEKLWFHLLDNAIKFRRAAPLTIHISAEQQDRSWQLKVCDNGIGIEKAFLEKAVLIFKRLHARAQYPGIGLGLALCRKIVEYHGGWIHLESEPGQGTCIILNFPKDGSRGYADFVVLGNGS